jgi:hypothetical protein
MRASGLVGASRTAARRARGPSARAERAVRTRRDAPRSTIMCSTRPALKSCIMASSGVCGRNWAHAPSLRTRGITRSTWIGPMALRLKTTSPSSRRGWPVLRPYGSFESSCST